MSLTRDFKETIKARIDGDPAFREELLKEGVECLLSGDVETGKAVLRDYINATIGFQELGGLTEKSPKSLIANVRSQWESSGAEPVRGHRPPSGTRGSSLQSSGNSISSMTVAFGFPFCLAARESAKRATSVKRVPR